MFDLCEPSDELITLSNQILEIIMLEDKLDDFKKGGMYREKAKAKNYQSS